MIAAGVSEITKQTSSLTKSLPKRQGCASKVRSSRVEGKESQGASEGDEYPLLAGQGERQEEQGHKGQVAESPSRPTVLITGSNVSVKVR
jgi:hypothetical protein